MRSILITLLLILPLIAVNAQTRYYVSITGNNTNNGSQATPFRTIQYAINTCSSGDTIYVMSGVYNEKVNINKSNIKLSAMSGHTPIIDGNSNTVLTPAGRQGLITIADRSYIKVIGFEIRDFYASSNNTPVGIYIEGEAHHIEIRNNRIHNIEGGEGAHAIGVFGVSEVEATHDLIFDGNEIYDCKLYWSEAFVLNGNVRNFEITNNSVHDCDNIAYDFIGYEGECGSCTGATGTNVDRARDGYVAYNVAYNIDTKDNLAYGNERSAAGFYVDGGDNIIFEGNISHDCNIGIELASEHYGKSTSNIIVRNNLVYNNHVAGIATGGYSSGTGPGGGQATNCTVINNTLYHNNNSTRSQDGWGAELYLQNRNINNTYQNNIVIANNYDRVSLGSLNSGIVWSKNLFSGSPGGDVPVAGNPVFGNPSFVNAAGGNFNLNNNSAAINAGAAAASSVAGTLDFNKNSRVIGTSIDIGAIEYNSVMGIYFGILNNSNNEISQVQFYPNPANDFIIIQNDESNTNLINCKIVDANGKIWKYAEVEASPKSDPIKLLINDLPSNIYVLILQYEDKVMSGSLIKK